MNATEGDNSIDSIERRIEKRILVEKNKSIAIDLLADQLPLSRQKLKQAMEKGSIWLKKARGGRRRLRRAKTVLDVGDSLEVHYDPHILSAQTLSPTLIADNKGYSVWFKPALMLSQGSKFADHCAITRWIEKNHQPKRAVYLVHRLDRAASGLMLFAHNQKAAARLSKLFSARNIVKRYTVIVSTEVKASLPLKIDTPIDGKTAETVVLSAQAEGGQSTLLVEIKTGRKHQIRRHLSEQGWPVLGDKLYGEEKSEVPLRLTASYLKFICPVSNAPVEYQLDQKFLDT